MSEFGAKRTTGRQGSSLLNKSGAYYIDKTDQAGDIIMAHGTTVPADATAGFAVGAIFTKSNGAAGARVYINEGSVASSAFKAVKTSSPGNEAVTATADGLTTGIISETAQHVTVTSAAATNMVTLPSGAAANVGKRLTIWVGANGFELITPAASNATINNVDSDGTNQADIPANTLSELHLVAVNTWLLRSNTNLGAVATAIIPDND